MISRHLAEADSVNTIFKCQKRNKRFHPKFKRKLSRTSRHSRHEGGILGNPPCARMRWVAGAQRAAEQRPRGRRGGHGRGEQRLCARAHLPPEMVQAAEARRFTANNRKAPYCLVHSQRTCSKTSMKHDLFCHVLAPKLLDERPLPPSRRPRDAACSSELAEPAPESRGEL